MKQRIVSAAVGVLILVLVLCFFHTIILNAAVGIITFMAVFEMLVAKKYVKHGTLMILCLVFSIFVSCLSHLYFYQFLIPISIVFIFLLMSVMICQYPKIKFETVTTAFFISMIMPTVFQIFVYFRDKYSYSPKVALFYILLSLGSAWICDSGAYFAGILFGKRKLARDISPKKTVEGFIGGLISSVCFGFILSFVFSYIFLYENLSLHVSYSRMFFSVLFASMLGVIGDLAASVIKRQSGIKDFGSIMPGHGGVLDRFDSVIFVLPFYYLVDVFLPLAK